MIYDLEGNYGSGDCKFTKNPALNARDILRPFALLAETAFVNFVYRHPNPTGYRTFLEQTYHYVRETVPTLRRVAAMNPHSALAGELSRLADEEEDHDTMLLNDLAQLSGLPSRIPISPPLLDYIRHAQSIPPGRGGLSAICGDIVAMEGYPPTPQGIRWIAGKFKISERACTALLEHAVADAVHAPQAFERLGNREIDPWIALGRAVTTLKTFTAHWEWLSKQVAEIESASVED